jgi:hypothetical protein
VPANSDFYPFVDLNAPRLRYMRTNAVELPALTVLPIPFLELLARAPPRGPTVEPGANSALFRDRLVLRALEIQRAVSSGNPGNLDPLSARYLWLIDSSRGRCADAAAQSAWHDAIRSISDDTAPYLNPGELEGIWNKVSSSACYREVTGEQRAWADLLAAIAQRNAPDIVRLGHELLGSDSSKPDEDLAYLTTVTAVAHVRMGQTDQARSLLQAQWHRFNHTGKFDLALRELSAMLP